MMFVYDFNGREYTEVLFTSLYQLFSVLTKKTLYLFSQQVGISNTNCTGACMVLSILFPFLNI